jgi:hypothetical protein
LKLVALRAGFWRKGKSGSFVSPPIQPIAWPELVDRLPAVGTVACDDQQLMRGGSNDLVASVGSHLVNRLLPVVKERTDVKGSFVGHDDSAVSHLSQPR